VLLNHVRGVTSFKHLRSRHGTTYATFRDACEAMGVGVLEQGVSRDETSE
jgi:hypothetical protein